MSTQEITLDPNNVMTHPDRNLDAIRKSLETFGPGRSVVIDGNNVVRAGNGTVEQAAALGIKVKIVDGAPDELIAVRRKDWDDDKAKAYAIADNRSAQFSEWDNGSLVRQLNELRIEDKALFEAVGFNDIELSDLVNRVESITDFKTDPDIVPDVPGEPTTKVGDLFELGDHRLLCGDATSKSDVSRLMDGTKIDIVLTDPPYGINLDTDYSKMPSTKESGNKCYKSIIGDNIKFNYKIFSWIDCDEQVWFGANYYAKTIDDDGSWFVWDKRVEEKFDRMFGSGFELAWSKKKHKQKIYRHNNTLFGGDIESRNKVHPTQKPTSLIVEILEDFKSGNVVLDLFLGSGSTLIACEKTSRKCYGMEACQSYCDIIVKRWEDFSGKTAHLINDRQ